MAGVPHPQTIYSAVFVDGPLSTSQDLTVGGVISTVVTAANIVTLGGKSAAAINNNKDSGFEFQWNNGTTSKLGFIGFQRSTSKYAFIPDANVSLGVYSGAAGTLIANLQGRADTATLADRSTLADTATNALSANTAVKLTTARTLSFTGDVVQVATNFDGTINVAASLILTPTGITAGAYNTSVSTITPMTFDAKGRLTALGTPVTITPSFNSITSLPTTLLGYGITDGVRSVGLSGPAQGIAVTGSTITSSGAFVLSLTNDLLAVEGLSSTGLVRRTADDTWTAGGLINLASEVTGNLPIANLASGTNASATTFFRGDNSWSSAVTSVTVAAANGVSATVATQGTTPVLTFALGAITPSSVASTGVISATNFTGSGAALTSLNASALSSGTVLLGRLGTTVPDSTMYLRGDNTWATALTTLSVVSANGITGTVANASTTPAITLTLGTITPTSVASTGAVSGTTFNGTTGSFTGALTAASFSGSGASLIALNASNLSTGTIALGRLGLTGTPSASTFLNGLNAWAGAVTAVTVATANGVSATVAGQGSTPALTFSLGDITPTSIVSGGAITGTTFTGSGANLTALNANNLATGTVAVARLGSTGVASITTFLRGDNAWSTAVTAVTVTSANGVSAAVATQGTTPALTFTLGAITPSSVNTAGSVTALSFIGSGAGLTTIDGGAITTGLIAPARLGSGTPSTVTYLRGDGFFSNAVTSVAVTTANGISGTVANATTTPTLTLVLGAITPSSIVASGNVTATAFIGSGALLTGLNANSLSSGTVPLAQLGLTGTPSASTYLAGDNSWKAFPTLTNGTVTAVTVTSANGITGTVATQGTTPALTIVLGAITPNSVSASGAISGSTLAGAGSAITALNASNLSSGTVATARLGTGTTIDGTTFLAGDQTYKTALTGATVVGNNGILTSFSVTAPASLGVPTITFSLGAITPISVAATGAISGSTLAGVGSAITALNASNLASGTIPLARIGTGTPSATTYLTGDNSWTTEKVLQVVTGSISSSSGNAAIPFDNTLPISTEGNLIWSQAFTPLSATSTIVITTSSFFSVGSTFSFTVSGAVFSDTTCIGAQKLGFSNNAGGGNNFCVVATQAAGSTAARTYSFRAGPNSSTSVYYGQGSGGQTYGNLTNSGRFVIMEIAA